MDIQKLQSLISREEGTKLDFKRELHIESASDKKEFAKDVSAIANSRGGRGYIIFGVEDKTKNIIGINPDNFIEEKIQQVIVTRCEPPIPISLELVNYKNKYIAVLTIYSGDQKPYQVKESGSFFTRRGSTTDIMRKEELASLLQDTGILSYELTPVIRAGIDCLDMAKVKDYALRVGALYKELNNDIFERLGIIVKDRESNEYHPTAGGLLLFGYNPQLYLPHCSIRVVNKINKDLHDIATFTGPVIEMLDKAEEFIKNVIDNSAYPVDAVNKALENAVVHRDYFDLYDEISVYLLETTCQVLSPGSLINYGGNSHGLTLPSRRNNWLYQRLMILDTKNRFTQTGMGLKKMRQDFKDYGRVKIFNIPEKNLFKVIFPGIGKINHTDS